MNHELRHFLMLCGVLLLAVAGCSRSAVVIAPASMAAAEEPARPAEPAAPREEARPEPPPANGFPFPDDPGGKLLGKLLAPPVTAPPGEAGDGPRHARRPANLKPPEPPLPPGHADVVRLPTGRPSTALRPGPVPEGPPLADYHGTPPLPEAVRLPAGERVRLPAEDAGRLPLPLLGQPAPDRAPLDDPTADASLAAALAARMPERTVPAPFEKLAVPDPFENRQAVRSAAAPPEESLPAAGASPPPKP